jgi:hypothetical protein
MVFLPSPDQSDVAVCALHGLFFRSNEQIVRGGWRKLPEHLLAEQQNTGIQVARGRNYATFVLRREVLQPKLDRDHRVLK